MIYNQETQTESKTITIKNYCVYVIIYIYDYLYHAVYKPETRFHSFRDMVGNLNLILENPN